MNALELRHVSKSFGGLQVVSDLSFAIPAGRRAALIGPNGAGKTTVFNLVSGVFGLDQGSVLLHGRNVTQLPSRERVRCGLARNFQNIRLIPHLSALENLMLGQHARAGSWREMLRPLRLGGGGRWAEEAMAELEHFGLAAHAAQPVGALPYGTRKCIEIVRALLSCPCVLLLDEPCAGLNTREREDLTRMLRGLESRDLTVVIVEHDMPFISELCDHVVVLNFGTKISEGSPAQVRTDPAVIEAYIGAEAA